METKRRSACEDPLPLPGNEIQDRSVRLVVLAEKERTTSISLECGTQSTLRRKNGIVSLSFEREKFELRYERLRPFQASLFVRSKKKKDRFDRKIRSRTRHRARERGNVRSISNIKRSIPRAVPIPSKGNQPLCVCVFPLSSPSIIPLIHGWVSIRILLFRSISNQGFPLMIRDSVFLEKEILVGHVFFETKKPVRSSTRTIHGVHEEDHEIVRVLRSERNEEEEEEMGSTFFFSRRDEDFFICFGKRWRWW